MTGSGTGSDRKSWNLLLGLIILVIQKSDLWPTPSGVARSVDSQPSTATQPTTPTQGECRSHTC
jgi:hypothetical protein